MARLIYPSLYFLLAAGITLGLLQWPDPVSPDGYFYFKNIQELSAFRGFYFHDYSLSFLFPAAINLLVRNVHLAMAMGIGLAMASVPFSLSALVLAGKEARAKAPYVLAIAILALAVQFPFVELGLGYFKNFFALAVCLASLACLAVRLREPKRAGANFWLGAALSLGLLALLCHKTMLFWLLALGLVFFSPELQGGILRRLSKRALLLLPAGAFLLLLAVIAISYRNFGKQLAGAMSFDSDPDPFRFWLIHSLEEEGAFAVATILSWAAGVFFLFRMIREPKKHSVAAAAVILILALIYHPWQLPGSQGLHYRLWMLLPILPAYCLASLPLSLPPLGSGLLTILLLGAGVYEFSDVQDNIRADFVPYSELRAEVRRLPEFVKPEDRLYCRHGLEFFVDYETPIRCRSFVDPIPRPNTWRLAFVKELRSRGAIKQLREASPLAVGKNYLLVPENTWQEVVKKFHLRPGNDNPSAVRQDFIHSQE